MKLNWDGGRLALAVLFTCLGPLPAATAQSQSSQDKEEAFDKVDPYTKGESAALEKLGYVQFGPLVFFDKVRTESIEEALGGVPILWVETAHFRIGSNLRTYKPNGDAKEDRTLEEELKRLKSRLPSTVRLPKNKLDPWLRLHLAAQRLEEQYQDFEQRFGFTDADFATKSAETGTFMGEGPYLGMEQKFVLLMTEKQSATVRFLKQFLETESPNWQRWHTRAGATILAISAESLKTYNYEREIDLHATVAAEMALNFIEAFRKGGTNVPVWFRAGIAHYYSRAVDERCTVSAVGTSHDRDAPRRVPLGAARLRPGLQQGRQGLEGTWRSGRAGTTSRPRVTCWPGRASRGCWGARTRTCTPSSWASRTTCARWRRPIGAGGRGTADGRLPVGLREADRRGRRRVEAVRAQTYPKK
jgi:hypothetical protein